MTSSRTRRSAPPTTASARPRSRTAAPAAIRSAPARGLRGLLRHFSTIFGEFMDPRGQRQNAARGADLRYDMELTPGGSLRRRRPRRSPSRRWRDATAARAAARAATAGRRRCGTCGGAGKVRAQQGFFVVERGCPTCQGSGETIADPCPACDGEGRALKRRKLSASTSRPESTRARASASSGEGEAGIRGAASGDLYIFVHMKRHAIFQREGTTLVAECPVSFTTAALGGTIAVPGVDGDRIEIKIPPESSRARHLRHRGAGMSILNGRGRGDLVARILVETPTRLSAKQKELLERIPRHRDRRGMPGDEELLPAHQGQIGRLGCRRGARKARRASPACPRTIRRRRCGRGPGGARRGCG